MVLFWARVGARGGGATRMARGGIRLVHGLTKSTLITYFSGMKKDPKYVFLHAFFLICLSCSFQNLSIWPENTPFFSNFARFCTPKRCTHVKCLVLKNNPNYVIFWTSLIPPLIFEWPPGGWGWGQSRSSAPLTPHEMTLCTGVYGELPFWVLASPPCRPLILKNLATPLLLWSNVTILTIYFKWWWWYAWWKLSVFHCWKTVYPSYSMPYKFEIFRGFFFFFFLMQQFREEVVPYLLNYAEISTA